jgi:hypothetical protein
MAKVWINKNFSRDGETTSIRAVVGNKPEAGEWVEGKMADVVKYTQLYIQGGNRYYGYL